MGADKVVLLGSEFGGLGAIIAAADMRPPVEGVIDLSSPDDLAGMDGRAAAARLTVPALFIVSASDPWAGTVRADYAATKVADRHLGRCADLDVRLAAHVDAMVPIKTSCGAYLPRSRLDR